MDKNYWIILSFFLLIVMIVQEIAHRIERKDLYSRIMAKDLTEYQYKKSRPVQNMIKKHIDENLKKR